MIGKNETGNYISLQEATKYCKYSQEYLSLRVRQGKLKAVKIGRNWVTKKEWVEEYIAKAGAYKNNNLKKVKKEIPPPKNLPVGRFDEKEFIQTSSIQLLLPRLRVLTAVLFILIFTIFILIIANIYIDIDKVSVIKEIAREDTSIFRDYFQWFGDNIKTQTASSRVIIFEFGQGFKEGLDELIRFFSKP